MDVSVIQCTPTKNNKHYSLINIQVDFIYFHFLASQLITFELTSISHYSCTTQKYLDFVPSARTSVKEVEQTEE